MNRSLFLAAVLSLSATSAALAQPDATTDVDATTTPAEQSPLAPEQAVTEPPAAPSLDDLINGIVPYQPPPAPAALVTPDAPAEVLIVVPATPPLPPPTAAGPVITRPPYAMSAPQWSAPPPAAVQAEALPVFVSDLGTTVGSTKSATDAAYENRVLGVFHTQQGKQGPLDGRWVIQSAGIAMYTLQLADPGAGESRVEGAWRNLRNAGANSSGFVEEVSREGDRTRVRFTDTDDRRTEVWLTPDFRGGWAGEAVWPEGRQSVVMSRDQSVEVLAFSVPAYIPPPPPPPKPKVVPKKGKKSKAAPAKKRRPAAAPSRGRAKRK